MKVIKPVVSSVHICIFYIICECMSGAGSARNVQIDDRPGSNVGDIIHRSSQSGRDKLLDDSLIPSDASYDSHSYADCKDCKDKEPHDDVAQGEISPPEVSIVVRTFQSGKNNGAKREEKNRRRASQNLISSLPPKRFKHLVDKTIRKFEKQWKRLDRRLKTPPSRRKHISYWKNKVNNVDFRRSGSSEYPTQPSKQLHGTSGGGTRLILNAISGNDKFRRLSQHSSANARGSQASTSPEEKGVQSGSRETVPRDEGKERHHGNTDASSPGWQADDSGRAYDGNTLVRPAMADTLEGTKTSLLASVQKLRRHTHAMMRAFIASEHQLDQHHQVISNFTRNVLVPGARDATEMIHEANEYILDGMNKANRVRQRENLRYHLRNDRRRKGFFQDESRYSDQEEREALAMMDEMKSKDFYGQLRSMETREDEIRLFAASVYSLKSECLEVESEAKRIRQLFDSKDYYLHISGLRNYLNDAIRTMNTGFLHTPAMRQLRYLKRLLDSAYALLDEGGTMVRKSDTAIRAARSNQEDNRRLVEAWLARRQRGGRGSGRGETPERVGPNSQKAVMGDLSLKVMEADKHSKHLTERADRDQRFLILAVGEAERFLSKPSGRAAELPYLTENLRQFIPEMYTALEEIGNLTGSKVNLTRPKRCKLVRVEVFEGSGDGDGADLSDDERLECEDDGDDNSKAPTTDVKEKEDDNDNKSNGGGLFNWFSFTSDTDNESGDDFTFEESEPTLVESVDHQKPASRQQNVTSLNRDIKDYTAESLKVSRELLDQAQSLNKSLKNLQQSWGQTQDDVIDIEKTIDSHRALNTKLEEMAKDCMSVTSRIEHLKNLPSTLQLNRMVRRAKRIERKHTAVATGKEEPNDGWMDDYYTFDYYDDDYYYDDDEGEIESNTNQDLEQRDAAVVNYEELNERGRQIESNYDDIKRVKDLAVACCGRVGSKLGALHGNLSALRHKVHQARDMLSTMQLSISKKGKGHIAIPLQPIEDSKDLTSIRLCIKPISLNGPVLVVQGNESASYSLSLDEGIVTARVYNKDWSELHEIKMSGALEKDTWFTIQIQRLGLYLNVSVQPKDKDTESETLKIDIDKVTSIKSEPAVAYLGGVPEEIYAFSGSWEGCIGDLSVNGHSPTLYTPDSEGLGASLCDSHCATRKGTLSTIFNGDGFLHYSSPVGEDITSIEFKFTTHQQTTSLVSVVNKTEGFYIHIMLEEGVLKVESSSIGKSVVYLSSNKEYGDGISHHVQIDFRDSATHITVDEAKDDFQVKSSKPVGEEESLQGIVMGAFVSNDRQFYHNKFRPFIGCISDVSVNGEKLLLSQAEEVYRVYRGHCGDAQHQIWHSCREWREESSSVVLGEMPDSKLVSLWVSSNATGPLLRYARQGDFTMDLTVNSDGLAVSVGDSSEMLSRPKKERAGDFFSVTIVDEPGSSNVAVFAWKQSMDYSYSSGWFTWKSDADKPHSLVIGGPGQRGEGDGGEAGKFAGSLSRVMVENRSVDLSPYKTSHKLSACQRPLNEVPPRDVEDSLPVTSCS